MPFFVYLLIPLALVLLTAVAASRAITRYDIRKPETQIPTSENVARQILERHAISGVEITAGHDDFYLPLDRRIGLDSERFSSGSTSGAAIAAHEAAHAVQHGVGHVGFKLWYWLAIPSTLASLAWFPVGIAAIALDSEVLRIIAAALFGFTAVVSLVTIWIEVDASKRALEELDAIDAPGIDRDGARTVLFACGATYVADTLLDLGAIGRRVRGDGDGPSSDRGGFFDSLLDW